MGLDRGGRPFKEGEAIVCRGARRNRKMLQMRGGEEWADLDPARGQTRRRSRRKAAECTAVFAASRGSLPQRRVDSGWMGLSTTTNAGLPAASHAAGRLRKAEQRGEVKTERGEERYEENENRRDSRDAGDDGGE
jgi:hypothetical protein